MTNFNILTPEISEIDKTISFLKTKRARLVAKEASKKAKALASEIARRKAAK
jgi:hypothetical protein